MCPRQLSRDDEMCLKANDKQRFHAPDRMPTVSAMVTVLGDDDDDDVSFAPKRLRSSPTKARVGARQDSPRSNGRKRARRSSTHESTISDFAYDSRVYRFALPSEGLVRTANDGGKACGTYKRDTNPRAYTESYLVPLPSHDVSRIQRRAADVALLSAKISQEEDRSNARVYTRRGPKYEAAIPRCNPGTYKSKVKRLWDDEIPVMVQMWDPRKADEAERRGEHIEDFLSQTTDLVGKEFLMELLHLVDYSVSTARDQYVQLQQTIDAPSSMLTEDEGEKVIKMIADQSIQKDFVLISKKVGRSVSDCLVHYYRWKASESGRYAHLKHMWKSDYCFVCKDGGNLVICDACDRGYHPECLDPPMKKLPPDEWLCGDCSVLSKPKLAEKTAKMESMRSKYSMEGTASENDDRAVGDEDTSNPRGRAAVRHSQALSVNDEGDGGNDSFDHDDNDHCSSSSSGGDNTSEFCDDSSGATSDSDSDVPSGGIALRDADSKHKGIAKGVSAASPCKEDANVIHERTVSPNSDVAAAASQASKESVRSFTQVPPSKSWSPSPEPRHTPTVLQSESSTTALALDQANDRMPSCGTARQSLGLLSSREMQHYGSIPYQSQSAMQYGYTWLTVAAMPQLASQHQTYGLQVPANEDTMAQAHSYTCVAGVFTNSATPLHPTRTPAVPVATLVAHPHASSAASQQTQSLSDHGGNRR